MTKPEKTPTVSNPVERVVSCTIHDYELMNLVGKVPLPVQIRQRLNKEGFEFEDDNKLSLIINENPKPKGEFIQWYSNKDKATTYKQRLYS